MNCDLATGSERAGKRAGAAPLVLLATLLLLALPALQAGCGSSSEEKPGKTVLKTRSGETGIQVTESEQDGTQVVRITTTFRGEESTIVLAVDQPSYEVDIPLSIRQVQPDPAGGGAPGAPGAPAGAGDSGRQFEALLIAQYLEKSQTAMIDGAYNQALRQINLVLLVRPDHVKAHEMKGSVYYAMGNFELANEEWEQVLALDPSNQEVRDFQDFLKNRQGAPQPPPPGGNAGGAAPAANPAPKAQ